MTKRDILRLIPDFQATILLGMPRSMGRKRENDKPRMKMCYPAVKQDILIIWQVSFFTR